jgi:cation transport protein ChaC
VAVPIPKRLPTPAQNPRNPRNPANMLEAVTREWGGRDDLWIFGYASLIWRPEFDFSEDRFAVIHGYHRALKMWSRVNRGTPDCPGLVFGLLAGGSCRGVAYRIPASKVAEALPGLWDREMPNGVYDPKWLRCQTGEGVVRALAFTLSRHSPNHTGTLSDDSYRQIFSDACGRYGTTRDYAQLTYDKLRALGIHDRALQKLLLLANP